MAKKPPLPEFPTGPQGHSDELCDRGENGKQCHRHPSHAGSHVYDPEHEDARKGKLTNKDSGEPSRLSSADLPTV